GVERAGELEEIVGYHLEQAALYRRELGLDDDGAAVRAAERLGASGGRSHDQGDLPAAENLLRRAVALLPVADPLRVRLLPLLGSTLFALGALDDAHTALTDALAEAQAAGDRAAEIMSWAWDAVVRMQSRPDTDHDLIARELVTYSDEAEALGHSPTMLALRRVALFLALMDANGRELRKAAEELRIAARAAGDRPAAADAMYFLAASLTIGAFGPDDAIVELARLHAEAQGPLEEAALLSADAMESVYRGDYDGALACLARMNSTLIEFAHPVHAQVAWMYAGVLELQRGHLEDGEAVLRKGADELRALGEAGFLSTQLGLLGEALCRLERWDEAERAADEAEALTQAGDVVSQAYWRSVRARILAHHGDFDGARRLADEAVELMVPTETPIFTAAILRTSAYVDDAAGDAEAAAAKIASAIEFYERAGFTVAAERLRTT
ncbi:MAG: hypothetical protein ACYDA3_02640, partial [Gaiellaceae bacterium]